MRNYFCGWYFKMQSKEKTLAIIPSYHHTATGNHSSIQFITDHHHVWVMEYPIEAFHKEKKGLDVSVNGNRFSEKGIYVDIHEPGFEATGELNFGPWTGLPFHRRHRFHPSGWEGVPIRYLLRCQGRRDWRQLLHDQARKE